MTRIISCFLALVTIVTVCSALFAGALWLSGERAVPGGTPSELATASQASPSPAAADAGTAGAAQSGEQKLAAALRIAQTAPPGSHQPVQLTLTEAEANAIAMPKLERDLDFPLQRPSLHFAPGKLTVEGGALVGPATVPVAVTGDVAVNGGIPRLEVTGITASGIPAPPGLVDQVSQQLASSMRLRASDIAITVQHVTFSDHAVTIAGVTK